MSRGGFLKSRAGFFKSRRFAKPHFRSFRLFPEPQEKTGGVLGPQENTRGLFWAPGKNTPGFSGARAWVPEQIGEKTRYGISLGPAKTHGGFVCQIPWISAFAGTLLSLLIMLLLLLCQVDPCLMLAYSTAFLADGYQQGIP